jgi:hypothetical protein
VLAVLDQIRIENEGIRDWFRQVLKSQTDGSLALPAIERDFRTSIHAP